MNIFKQLIKWGASGVVFIVSLCSWYLAYLNYSVITLMQGTLENTNNEGSFAVGLAANFWPLLIIFGLSCLAMSIYLAKNTKIQPIYSFGLALMSLIAVIFMGVSVVSANYELAALVGS
ncbi:MAG: hypothetical protein AB2672_16905 [Candidatus Thiodiazotropha endolucinida]